MPIYEFYSPDTHKIYSFFARSLGDRQKIPRCPDDPKARMERLVSRFAVTGRARDQPDAGAESPMDPRLESAMADMEREMSGIDENNPDPRQLGRLMRKMTEATGQKIPAEMEHMLRRLESGEDPEKLEEEFGDALDEIGDGSFEEGGPGAEAASSVRAFVRNRARQPRRDPMLYEMRDFLT